ncbi:MAG: hypothetical protein DI556_19975 [Rhodovulum sulfidophilum]|uniref:HTH gntR-type domain-containing protein n=1 Tax=Rhodovulum sulfidophilum TaxID=35806 RepID=A0A2W5Q541_RHOSU|nr:MAG: hypothetical protein DI556_19975 [Rhodovulum sulfidophilum]
MRKYHPGAAGVNGEEKDVLSEDSAGDSIVDRPGFEASTLAHHVYRELESGLIDGVLLPETRLSLRSIATQLNTSMQPVREAVSKLVADSALEVTPGRAVRVPRLDREQADEVWAIRVLLEGEAAARFAARRRPEEVEALYAQTRAMRPLYFADDVPALMRALRRWNIALVYGSHMPVLTDLVMRLRLRYAPFTAACLAAETPPDPNFLNFTLRMQDEMTRAIEAGDVAAARYLRCSTIRGFQHYLYERIRWIPPLDWVPGSDAPR